MKSLTFFVLIGGLVILGASYSLYHNNQSNNPINSLDISSEVAIPTIDILTPTKLETATFALGCFWSPDALFGSTPGVIKTRVGYAGGNEESPTYRSIGGHTETIQIDYDPTQITYSELLGIFWGNHNPTYQFVSQQYKPIIFYHNFDQRQLAYETKFLKEVELNQTADTEIRAYTGFYIAEDYHQKYRLQQERTVFKEFKEIYPNIGDLIDSTAAARVNGFISGYGDPDLLLDELGNLGLSETAEQILIELFNERKDRKYC
jgi:methionine-S-sulfoxide reductase